VGCAVPDTAGAHHPVHPAQVGRALWASTQTPACTRTPGAAAHAAACRGTPCGAQVDIAVQQTVSHVNKLRAMSPLWELHQEGVDLKSIQWAQH
jgi:hypothetical protein